MKIFILNNNNYNLKECLNSFKELNYEIIIGTFNINDEIEGLYNNNNCKVKEIKNKKDFSFSKNKLFEDYEGWIFWIEPYEIILDNLDELKSIENKEPFAYRVQVLQNGIVTKPIRIWHTNLNLKWENPIFESVLNKNSYQTDIILKSKELPNIELQKEILSLWKEKSPEKKEIYYYESLHNLYSKKYNSFLNLANQYLFLDKNSISSYMLRYYMATIQLHVFNDFKNSIINTAICIKKNPSMSEFWCLYADIMLKMKNIKKAISLYENAIFAGELRLNDDEWPIDIEKYLKYPEFKINFCKNLLNSVKDHLISSSD